MKNRCLILLFVCGYFLLNVSSAESLFNDYVIVTGAEQEKVYEMYNKYADEADKKYYTLMKDKILKTYFFDYYKYLDNENFEEAIESDYYFYRIFIKENSGESLLKQSIRFNDEECYDNGVLSEVHEFQWFNPIGDKIINYVIRERGMSDIVDIKYLLLGNYGGWMIYITDGEKEFWMNEITPRTLRTEMTKWSDYKDNDKYNDNYICKMVNWKYVYDREQFIALIKEYIAREEHYLENIGNRQDGNTNAGVVNAESTNQITSSPVNLEPDELAKYVPFIIFCFIILFIVVFTIKNRNQKSVRE